MVNEPAFQTKPILLEFILLVTQHWNATSDALRSGNFLPLLLEDESGVACGNDWANGFMRGVEMRQGDWAMAHEHNPDPEMRSYNEPISTEMRERLIVGATVGVRAIYNYFERERALRARCGGSPATFRRDAPKVARNEPCPCGSGKKFKHCCAKATLH
jgi:uncharacterized protein